MISSSLVAVRIRLSRRVVGSNNAFNVHVEWSLGVISFTSGPFNSTRLIAWVSSSPNTSHNVHRTLWVALSVIWQQSSDHVTVHSPGQLVFGPFDSVGQVVLKRVYRSVVELTSVVGCGVTLRKEIGLPLGWISANQFNVNFIQIVTLQVEGRNDTLTFSGLHYYLDFTEHEVKIGFNRWVVKSLGQFEVKTVGRVRQSDIVNLVEIL